MLIPLVGSEAISYDNKAGGRFSFLDVVVVIDEALDALLIENADPMEAGWQLRTIAQQSQEQGPELLRSIVSRRERLRSADPAIVGGLLRALHESLLRSGRDVLADIDPMLIAQIESALPPAVSNRYLIQQIYALIGSANALQILVESLAREAPRSWIEAAQVLSPLMQDDSWPVEAMFPAALECLQHPSSAAPLLDLANHTYRKRQLDQHPAADRLALLNQLLGEVASRLARFEEDPRSFGDDVDAVSAKLGEAVALAVSLCDTVGLIGDPSSIPKLNQVVQLKHRRVQCEAAGALARLGDQGGKQRLVELTADPAARLRAIHYLDELGLGDMVDDQYRSETATAESEIALWLSQPQNMGVPPTAVQVIDQRRLMWPGYEHPVDVFLVHFEYSFGDRVYSNVGVAGPVTYSLSVDVANLPVEDIYAIYAGWHAEHNDIYAIPVNQWNESQHRAMEDFQQHLERLGYQALQPKLLGVFLDEQAGVFTATRDATHCLVVTDGLETIDQPISGRLRPLTPEDLFHLYKGRKMLRTFNPES